MQKISNFGDLLIHASNGKIVLRPHFPMDNCTWRGLESEECKSQKQKDDFVNKCLAFISEWKICGRMQHLVAESCETCHHCDKMFRQSLKIIR